LGVLRTNTVNAKFLGISDHEKVSAKTDVHGYWAKTRNGNLLID
jgi:hypothetical protein